MVSGSFSCSPRRSVPWPRSGLVWPGLDCSIFGPCCRGVGPCTSNVATSHINLIRRNYFLLLNCNSSGSSSANKRVLPQCINLHTRAGLFSSAAPIVSLSYSCVLLQPQQLPFLLSFSPPPWSTSPAPIPINNCVHLSKSCLMFAVWLFGCLLFLLFLLAQVSFCFFGPALLLLHM